MSTVDASKGPDKYGNTLYLPKVRLKVKVGDYVRNANKRKIFSYDKDIGIFSVSASPSLVGAYYLQPPDAGAKFLHNFFLCNDTCSVTWGSITY